MFRPKRLLLSALGLLLLIAPAPAVAETDSMLQLVREIAAQPSAHATATKPRKARDTRRGHRFAKGRGRKPAGRARRPRLHLSAAARGSGRIDVIDASGPVSFDERPAIATKRGF